MDAKASFKAFLEKAWGYFRRDEARQPDQRKSVSLMLRDLYLTAATPSANKDPLQGGALYASMADFLERATAMNGTPLTMKLQGHAGWNIASQAQQLVDYYRRIAVTPAAPQNDWQALAQERLPRDYIHAYPANPAAGSDWRIALNVMPGDIPKAMTLCRPLLYQSSAIDHLKFLPPGKTAKCDTVLCFLKKDDSYDALRGQFMTIANQLALQPCVGAMWQEDPDKPGFGEASEPPQDLGVYMAFTEYRCLVVYLAYKTWRGERYSQFLDHLAQVMALFGLDANAPQLQGPLSPALQGENSGYLDAYLAYKQAWKENR